jgi:cytochrome c oxidase cbb3-type subunit 3
MSDFFNNFWSWYVAVGVVVSIGACLVLLWLSSKVRVPATADNTTGHVWDGDLREMNNPLPRWWVWLFVITIVFAAIYLVLFPGLGSYPGQLGWSARAQHSDEMHQGAQAVAPLYARFAGMSAQDMVREPQAMAIGERLFMNNCAQCHGSDARGSKGFPNLSDKDWLYGGTPELITHSISQGRNGQMPPMAAAVGTPEDVKNLAHYVLSLSGSPHDTLRASLGKSKFGSCAACHGVDGKGNTAMGAPNLTDDIWLHGWGEAAIVAMVNKGRANLMPAQGKLLTEDQIKVLGAYVWGLSNRP